MSECGYALKFEKNIPVSVGYNMTHTNALRKLKENESVFFPCSSQNEANGMRYRLMASLRYLRKIGDVSWGGWFDPHGQKIEVVKENCSFGVRVWRIS